MREGTWLELLGLKGGRSPVNVMKVREQYRRGYRLNVLRP